MIYPSVLACDLRTAEAARKSAEMDWRLAASDGEFMNLVAGIPRNDRTVPRFCWPGYNRRTGLGASAGWSLIGLSAVPLAFER